LLSGKRSSDSSSQLEALSCECYAVVKRESDRLLPQHLSDLTKAEKPQTCSNH
jgi:glucose-6-phosphate-specific signal transduction histidine kinase